MVHWMIAVAAAALVAGAGWWLSALRASGAVAATLVGAVVLGFAGLAPAVVLVLFFASSSALSRFPGDGGRSRRGARQVFANGSVAAVAATLHDVSDAFDLAFLGALATATADTWATEVGVRLSGRPRSILSLRPVPPGTSGGVSVPGSLAGIVGTFAVAWAGFALWSSAWAAAAAGGLIGATADSVLGAGVQAVYRCPECGAEPEVAWHDGCDSRARRVTGMRGLDNDAVNWIATLIGAGAAVALSAMSPILRG